MTTAYADLDTLKSTAVLNLTGSAFDSRLLALLEDVSRWIDAHCNRHFYVLTASRRFDGDGGTQLGIPDLISVTTLASDEDQDRVFETTWSSSDYLLYPLNAEPQQPWGRPYSRLLVDKAAGSRASFPPDLRLWRSPGDGDSGKRLRTAARTSMKGPPLAHPIPCLLSPMEPASLPDKRC